MDFIMNEFLVQRYVQGIELDRTRDAAGNIYAYEVEMIPAGSLRNMLDAAHAWDYRRNKHGRKRYNLK